MSVPNERAALSTRAAGAPVADRAPTPLDPIGIRRAFSRFGTGVTVVTTGGPFPHGMTANSFTSVSLAPPLVLVCVLRDTVMHEAVLESRSFAVSVLSARQEGLARYFADRHRPRGPEQFELVGWSPGRLSGIPVLDDSLAWMECSLRDAYDGGDHSIFVGEVLDIGLDDETDALLFFDSVFHGLYPASGN
jgi:flavin reductase (DIM6/NTAB) family NADH-FMN oxidoreductase RutF